MTDTVDAASQPTSDWTVEELLQWLLEQSQQETNDKAEELINSLRQKYERGTTDLYKCFEEYQQDKENCMITTIHIAITQGPHTGAVYHLSPKSAKDACMVGRSTSKKFRDRGISLHKDTEVSTTHGKFEIRDGKAYFTDVKSTNGSIFMNSEGDSIPPHVPHELQSGMQLLLGATLMEIQLE